MHQAISLTLIPKRKLWEIQKISKLKISFKNKNLVVSPQPDENKTTNIFSIAIFDIAKVPCHVFMCISKKWHFIMLQEFKHTSLWWQIENCQQRNKLYKCSLYKKSWSKVLFIWWEHVMTVWFFHLSQQRKHS